MKKTLTINLNGSVFHIDEDAFQRLNNYLNAIDKHFPNAEDKEILRDIEARIAELFSEKLINRNVVEIADVEQVISILGQPNQFGGENETETEQPKNEPHAKQHETKKSARKLYRDTDNQVLGGVLAGLAAYFNFDVVWLRILAVVLVVFGFGSPIILYIIAWLIMPEAKTAAQKLEMRGEAVNIDSIKNFFESEQLRENARKVGSRVGEIVPILAKIIFVFAGFIAAIVGFSVIFALLVAAVVLLSTGSWLVFGTGIISNSIFWSAVAGLVLIPAIGMFVGGIRLIKNRQNPQNMQRRSSVFGWTMFSLWIISLLVLIASAIHISNFEDGNFRLKFGNIIEYKLNQKAGPQITESRNISTFNAVEIGNGIDVEFVNSDSLFVDITAGENIIKNVQCEVKDGVLHIKSKVKYKIFNFNNKGIKAKIGIGNLKSIVAHNGCDIVANDTIFGENLLLKFSNACDINIYAKANEIKLDCHNACDADFDFTANTVNMNFSNACDIDGTIKASFIFADFSNACDAKLMVNSDLLQINAGNACDIKIQGVTKKLNTTKKNASSIKTDNLKVISE